MAKRKIIVNVATSADGYLARVDGDLDWLTERPAPEGFYGLPKFESSIDAKILGRKTFEKSVQLGAKFRGDSLHYVFSRQPPPSGVPAGVQFVAESIRSFAERQRSQEGKNIWLMGGAQIVGAFLDAGAIDEFIITVVPILIGEGIPLLGPGRRKVKLELLGVEQFPDGVTQLRYRVPIALSSTQG